MHHALVMHWLEEGRHPSHLVVCTGAPQSPAPKIGTGTGQERNLRRTAARNSRCGPCSCRCWPRSSGTSPEGARSPRGVRGCRQVGRTLGLERGARTTDKKYTAPDTCVSSPHIRTRPRLLDHLRTTCQSRASHTLSRIVVEEACATYTSRYIRPIRQKRAGVRKGKERRTPK